MNLIILILFLICVNWTSLIIRLHLSPILNFSITVKKIVLKRIDENVLLEQLNQDKNYSRKYHLLKGENTSALIEIYNVFAFYYNDLALIQRVGKYPYIPFYYLLLERQNRKSVLSFKIGQGLLLTVGLIIYLVVAGIMKHGAQIRIEGLILGFIMLLAVIPFCMGGISRQNIRIFDALDRMQDKK